MSVDGPGGLLATARLAGHGSKAAASLGITIRPTSGSVPAGLAWAHLGWASPGGAARLGGREALGGPLAARGGVGLGGRPARQAPGSAGARPGGGLARRGPLCGGRFCPPLDTPGSRDGSWEGFWGEHGGERLVCQGGGPARWAVRQGPKRPVRTHRAVRRGRPTRLAGWARLSSSGLGREGRLCAGRPSGPWPSTLGQAPGDQAGPARAWGNGAPAGAGRGSRPKRPGGHDVTATSPQA
jgi:hypothetical protein